MAKSVKKKVTKKTSKSAPKAVSKASRSSKKKAVTKKKTTSKPAVKKKAATTKKVTKKKTAPKKAAKKKAVTKKVTKKKVTKKKVAKKTVAKKKVAKKTTTKKKVVKKAATKKPSASTAAPKKKVKKKPTAVTVITKKPTGPGKEAKKIVKPKPGVIKRPRVPYAALSAPAKETGYDPHNHTPPTPAQLRKVKTGLTRKDLNFFRSELLERRAEIIGDVQGLEAARSGNSGEISHMPLHMADVGSDNYEQEFTLGLMESERKIIIEIDEALQRIQDKTYGVCIESGVPIGRPRLEAKPWAKYCIEVARERERRGL